MGRYSAWSPTAVVQITRGHGTSSEITFDRESGRTEGTEKSMSGTTVVLAVVVLILTATSCTAPPTVEHGERMLAAQKRLIPGTDGFDAALDAADAAQLLLQNGQPEAYKSLWSRSDDVTLAGGFGGAVEKGWPQVSRRLDWAATQFSKASHTNERVVAYSSGDLGYVVQRESIRYFAPGQPSEMRREYRVTMVFRREADGWKIVHRQADASVARQTRSAQ